MVGALANVAVLAPTERVEIFAVQAVGARPIMGTNYYVNQECCPTCGHTPEREHIGKSSVGWKFLFAPLERKGAEPITSWKEWRAYLADKPIVDEYGDAVPLSELVCLVEAKQSDGLCAETASSMQYGPTPKSERWKHERKDADGYRFCTTADFT